ncbi:hypothetical protein TCAL_16902 [Tigriopus californicus]|uniref:EamA domain-containing protein n=1 Tax=Tigriopus californicus TaxID=6832 RepID=A0A553P895_TIGCA|nr:hypothetical protein TCAL_16902 [Tigriopus californicus]
MANRFTLIHMREVMVIWSRFEKPIGYSTVSLWTGVIISVNWALISALKGVLVNGFLKEVSPFTALVYTSIPSSFLMVSFYPLQSQGLIELWLELTENYAPILFMSTNTFFRLLLMFMANQRVDPNTISLIRCSEIVLDFLLQIFVMNEPANSYEIVGAGFVMGAIILLAGSKAGYLPCLGEEKK